jgi:hypothetical protein
VRAWWCAALLLLVGCTSKELLSGAGEYVLVPGIAGQTRMEVNGSVFDLNDIGEIRRDGLPLSLDPCPAGFSASLALAPLETEFEVLRFCVSGPEASVLAWGRSEISGPTYLCQYQTAQDLVGQLRNDTYFLTLGNCR